MKVFYATFGYRTLLGDHILKVFAIDESEAREILHRSRLLQSCVAFIYAEDEAREILHRSRLLQSCVAFIYAEDEDLALIQRFGYTVIEGKIGV